MRYMVLDKQIIKIKNLIKNNCTLEGLFLYGSQLYDLDLLDSDTDFVCIIDKNFSFSRVNFDFGTVWFVTPKEFEEAFKLNVEKTFDVLYTPYFYLNPNFMEQWEVFSNKLKSQITPDKIQKMLSNKIMEHREYLFFLPYPPFDGCVYEKKRAYHLLIRLEQWDKLKKGYPYEQIFLGTDYRNFIFKVKTTPNFLQPYFDIIFQKVEEIKNYMESR